LLVILQKLLEKSICFVYLIKNLSELNKLTVELRRSFGSIFAWKLRV